ncbi:MAG: hypothetical protein JWL90_398 [Chthoniobacteraceae bacterium]|nr:hypothetical protein [Chthoniobacteraceae bacterium]
MTYHSLSVATAALLLAVPVQAKKGDAKPDSTAEAKPGKEMKSSDLLSAAKVWTLHLSFTADQWAAMEPVGGPAGFGGRGPGGPPGGAPGGRGGFGPSMFLAPGFLTQGDNDKDGKISKSEFNALGEKWFAIWDKEKNGKVDAEQLRVGLNASFTPPPGGPGGPGRGMASMLQGAEGKRNGLASAMGIEFKQVHAELDFDGRLFKDVAVRYKGNGTFLESRGSEKRSMKIDLNKNVKGQKLAGISTLNLHSDVTDASWMNEVLSHRLYRDAGVPAPRTAYARVYVTVPGKYDKQYLGLYSLVEDIDKSFGEENFGTKKGAIFKPVTQNLFADLGDDWAKYKQTYDPKDDVSEDETKRVIEFCRFVTKADDSEFAARLGDYVQLDQFARYMAVTVWLSTLDSILTAGQNYYLYLHPTTHRFQFLPWDLDHSFGQFPMGASQEQRDNLSIQKPWRGENRFFERAFKVEAFKSLYLAKLDDFNKTIFKPERFNQQVDELAAAIRPAVQEESEAKLAKFDKAVAGEPLEGRGFGPGGGGGAPVKPIKGFVVARAQSVIDQVSGKSPGITLDAGGPGGPGGPGGRQGFGAGTFLGPAFMTAFDADKDASLSHDEFLAGFNGWFETWNTDKTGTLTDEQLRAGIDKSLAMPRGNGPR